MKNSLALVILSIFVLLYSSPVQQKLNPVFFNGNVVFSLNGMRFKAKSGILRKEEINNYLLYL